MADDGKKEPTPEQIKELNSFIYDGIAQKINDTAQTPEERIEAIKASIIGQKAKDADVDIDDVLKGSTCEPTDIAGLLSAIDNQTREKDEKKSLSTDDKKKEAIKLANAQIAKYNAGNPDKIDSLQDGASVEEALEMIKRLKALGNNNPKSKGGKGSLNVGGMEGGDNPTPNQEWLKGKKKIWNKFAQDKDLDFTTDPQHPDIFKLATKEGQALGSVKYMAPNNAQVSKDSKLEMYQALVRDAAESNLSITFGQSLDDTQKAMLLAAALMSQDRYSNGDKIELKDTPKIDPKAPYFKDLPENVQRILKAHNNMMELKAQNAEIKRLQGGSDEDKAKASKMIKQRREEAAKAAEEFRQASGNTSFAKKVETKDKILALRLGISLKDEAEEKALRASSAMSDVTRSDGKVSKESDRQAAAKQRIDDQFTDKKGNVDTAKRDQFIKALTDKYGKSQGNS